MAWCLAMNPAGAVGRSVPWDAGRSAGVQSWQDCAAMRSPASDSGKISPRCVFGRRSVAAFSLHAFPKGPRTEKTPVRGNISPPCIQNELGFGKIFAPCIRKAPQTGVRGYTARRSCQEGALFAARAPQIMHGARILPRPDGAEQRRGVRRTRYAAAPVAPVAPARCRSSSRARGARPTAFAASAILRPQHSPAPRSESAAAFSGTSLCSIESAHPPYIFIRRTRGGVFQLMLQEQLRFLPPRRILKRAVRLPWCTGPNPPAISTSSMRKARQSLSTTAQGSRRPSRPNRANTSTVSRCTRLISPSFALQSMSVY